MRNILFVSGVAVFLMAAGVQYSEAETAAERAAELKTWRAQCADPDPDFQIGYIEAAIEAKDQSILRVCLRQALNSDAADTRNLALRALIASSKRIVFQTEVPLELANTIKAAGKDKKKLGKIQKYYITSLYNYVRNGLSFEIADAEIGSSQSIWRSLVKNTEPSEDYQGIATLSGSDITWTGRVYSGSHAWGCDLVATVTQGHNLVGNLTCEDFWPIPISAKLL